MLQHISTSQLESQNKKLETKTVISNTHPFGAEEATFHGGDVFRTRTLKNGY